MPDKLAGVGEHFDELPELRGEVGALMRTMDWSKTSLGPMSTWPRSLKTMIGVLLGSRFPMMLGWGPDLLQFYNDAYVPVLGVKHPACLGVPVREVWSEIWDVVGPLMNSVLSGGPSLWREHQLLFINSRGFAQETFHTFSQSPVPDDQGRVGGVLLTVQETTEQVQGQRQLEVLRVLAEQTAFATSTQETCEIAASVLATDDADVPFSLIYLLNPGGAEARLVASSPVAVSSVDPALTRIELARSPESTCRFDEALRSGKAVFVDELTSRFGPIPAGRYGGTAKRAVVLPLSRDANERHGFLVLGLSPWREANDGYLGFLGLIATQLVSAISKSQAAEERQRLEAMAELDRAKTLFFSNVSHELRTPLTLILGPTTDALLSRDKRLEGESLEAVHRNAQRLQKLVGTLLDFARIEAGSAKAAFELIDIAVLTADLASAFESAMADADLAYEIRCEALPAPVYVDPDMWEKILLNLISNALKFTLEGRVRVSLAARGDDIELTVEDTGTGIPEAHLPWVFDRFHRVRGTKARTQEGSGIGLALVHELARLLGGNVSVKSTVGVGTTFTVTIPAMTADRAPEGVSDEKPATRVAPNPSLFVEEALRWLPSDDVSTVFDVTHSDAPSGSGPRGHVLVVDDNADMRDYLTRVLAKYWTVETAADGEIALVAARARRPDAVLTDVMMPNLDGFGLLRELRAADETADIPVILLSARAGEEVRIEGLRTGADDYLVKPFSARELLARVQVHVTLTQLRRRLLERAVEARHAAEEATRAKDEFLAMLGHELRNPLSPIVTAVYLLKQKGRDGKEIQIIERQLRQLVRLVDDLLDVSRITRGRIELHKEPVSVVEMVARAVETTEPLLEQRRHSVEVSVPTDIMVHGDPTRLEQVVANLLTNASKYSDPGRSIRVSARTRDGRVELRVIDEGIGIRPDLLERVFDVFVQQSQSLDRAAGGLGLGLAIVKNLVTAHGGFVRAESAGPGKGSVFVVDLPAFCSADEIALDSSKSHAAVLPKKSAAHRVLVVDDNEDGAEMLAYSVMSMGHRVRIAHDGQSALDAAEEFRPDVALLDIGLPVMDGYELASRLKEMPGGREIRLIAVTGYGQAGDRDASKQAGFSDHVVKPVDVDHLRDVIAATGIVPQL